ncbi:MAG: TolC family protein, partial [Bacteroidales bacterium]
MSNFKFIFLSLFILIFPIQGYASEPSAQGVTPLLNVYREKALNYNHDLKSIQKNIAASNEAIRMAKGEFLPQLSANAAYKYIGNPSELSINLPALGAPVGFNADNHQYGATLTVSQPIYTGGRLKNSLEVSQLQSELASNQAEALELSVLFQTDFKYWTTVANAELIEVTKTL